MADVIIPEANKKNGVPLTTLQRGALTQGSTAQALLEGVRSGVVPQPSGISPAAQMRQQSKALMEQEQAAQDARPSALVSSGAAVGGLGRDLWEATTGKTANTNVDSSWDVGQHRREYTTLYPRELWHSFEKTRNEGEYNALKERYAARSEREAAMAEHPWVSLGVGAVTDPLSIFSGLGALRAAQGMVKAYGITRSTALGVAALGEGTLLGAAEASAQYMTSGEITDPNAVTTTFLATSLLSYGIGMVGTKNMDWTPREATPYRSPLAGRVDPTVTDLPDVTGAEFSLNTPRVRRSADEPYVDRISTIVPKQREIFHIEQASGALAKELVESSNKYFYDFAKKGIDEGVDAVEAHGVPKVVLPSVSVPAAPEAAESALESVGAASNQAREGVLNDLRYKSQSDVTLDIIDTYTADWRAKAERLSDRAKAWIDQGALGTLRGKLSGLDFLMSSNSDVMKSVASSVGESSNGLFREVTSNVAVNKASFDRQIRASMMRGHDEYVGWAKRTGKGGFWSRLVGGEAEVEYNRLLREELEARDALNSKPRETWTDADKRRWETVEPEVRRHADLIDESMAMAVKIMKEQGMDVAHLEGRRGYVPRMLDGTKLAAMNNTASRAFRGALARRIKELFDENADILRAEGNAEARSISEANALALAAEMVGRAERAEAGIGGSTIALFDRAGRDELENILTGANMDAEEISRIFNMLDKRLGSTSSSNRMKGRMDLDVMKVDEQTGLRLVDFYDNDLSKIMTRYSEEMSGRAALHPTGLGNKNSMEQIRQAIEVEGKVTGEDLKKELEELEFMFDQFLGRIPDGQQRKGFVNALLQFAPLQMLGQVGWAQAAESSTNIGRLGVGSALKMIPTLGRLVINGREGMLSAADQKMLKDINAYLGPIGESFRTHRPTTDIREMVLTKSDIGAMADRALKEGQQFNGWLSGMHTVMEMQQKIAATVGARNMAAELMEGGVMSRRLKDAGFSEESLERYRRQFAKHAKDEDGNLLVKADGSFRSDDIWDLGFQQWDDQKLAREFMGNLERLAGQLIQRDFVGETAKWMYGDFARLAMSMRGYAVKSMQKQLIRNAFIMDGVTAATFAASSATSSLMYVARTYVNSIGREDQDEFLERRLSGDALVQGMLTYHTFGGILPDAARGPMSWYRSEDEDAGMRRGMQAGGMIEAMLPGLTPLTRFAQLGWDTGDAATGVLQGDDREVMTPRKIRQHVQAVAGNNIITSLGLNLLLDDSQ